MADAFVDALAELLGDNDAPTNAQQIDDLANLLNPTLAATEQELLAETLLASQDEELLARFAANSNVIKNVEAWINAHIDAKAFADLPPLLKLLAHLPITVDILTSSNVSKVIFKKVQKCGHTESAERAVAITKAWKRLVSDPNVTVRAPAAHTAGDAKRARTALASEDNSLDAVLAGASRKVSLAPDHLKPRRKVEQLGGGAGRLGLQPKLAPRVPSPASSPTSPTAPRSFPGVAAAGQPATCSSAPAVSAAAAPSARPNFVRRGSTGPRISWAPPAELEEVREYVVVGKRAGARGFLSAYSQELAREGETMKRMRQGGDPWSVGSSDVHTPQLEPAIPWRVPEMLAPDLHPQHKGPRPTGDGSSERERQMERRRGLPERACKSLDEAAGDPADPPFEPMLAEYVPVIPFVQRASSAQETLTAPAGEQAPFGGQPPLQLTAVGQEMKKMMEMQPAEGVTMQEQPYDNNGSAPPLASSLVSRLSSLGGGFGMAGTMVNPTAVSGSLNARLQQQLDTANAQQAQSMQGPSSYMMTTPVPGVGGVLAYPSQVGAMGRIQPYKKRQCRFWLQGMCKRGDACTFLHQ